MTKFYINEAGSYIGGFDGSPAPEGSIEVPGPPEHADDYVWHGDGWTEVPKAPEVPEVISDRQFFQVLALVQLISEQEALDAVQIGKIPARFEAFISALPTDQQFPARMLLTGATQFERSHPLTAAFGAAQGMSAADVDALWMHASTL